MQVAQGGKIPGTHGDIWPMTWADDDAIYSAASDTKGCPEGLFPKGRNVAIVRITGDSDSPTVTTLNPMEQFGEALSYEGDGEGKGSWKGSGLVCVDGRLFLAAFHHRYAFELKRFPWYSATDSYLVSSDDHGASWSRFSKAHAFPGPFGNPSFVQFGRNNEDARDDFVYAVSGAEGRWENNDSCILGRVRRDWIMNTESWVFFSGLDGTRPLWGDIGSAMPIIVSPGKIGCGPETLWHRESESFLLLTSSYPDLSRDLRDYRKAIDACHTRSNFTIFQSRTLWGPWKIVYEGRGTGATDYLPRMPCRWLAGRSGSAPIVSAGNFESRSNVEDHYGFVRGTITWEIG
jgi:hypothetical protein